MQTFAQRSHSLMLLATEQLQWSDPGFKWLPQGHHSGVCWGSPECCSFIFHTSTSPRLSVLKSYTASSSKKNNSFSQALWLYKTKQTCVCVCVRVCMDVSRLPLFSHSCLTVCLVCPTSSCCIMEVGDSHIWSQEMKDIIYKEVSALPLCVFLTHTRTHTHTHTVWHGAYSNRPQ